VINVRQIVNDTPGLKRAMPLEKDAKTITYDLDGVIVKTTPRVLEIFRQETGIGIDFKDIKEYNMLKFLRNSDGTPISFDKLRRLYKKAWSEPEKLERKDRNTRALMGGGPLSGMRFNILTSTWAEENQVLNFIKINRLFFDNLIMVENEKEKVKHAGDFHLDDNFETAVAISKAGKYSFLLETPYTPPFEKTNEHLFLVRDWAHFARMISSGAYSRGLSDLPGYEGVYIPPRLEAEVYSPIKHDIERRIR
jgi:hypothetical protein